MGRQPIETGGGGGGSGFAVSPDELEQSGRTARQTAETIPGETTAVLAASDQAEGGLRGWRTGIELNACTDEWRRVLDELSREMDSQGDKLIQTAANYRKGEEGANQGLVPTDSNVRALSGPSLASAGAGAPGRATPVGERLLRGAFDGPQVTTQPHLLTPDEAARVPGPFDGPQVTTKPYLIPPGESDRFRRAFDPPAPNPVPVVPDGFGTGAPYKLPPEQSERFRDAFDPAPAPAPEPEFEIHHVEQPADPRAFYFDRNARGL
ncbi:MULTISPECIES: WXG100 family type VII secretion target [Kitasatospora]|uniref:Uncharacterized protein n=1 Tax=Kitasatospora setae (strain ATCC 33774 / DSM 43861 / JCM 3304 / KCC A-0304 / NBRC 14216 / KM-6054) TaxID=452652 RepID=E4NF32_KITSK|nr:MULTISPECIES: WXG100 family type VII secretion target [Kitasatospora]BAJ30112.1 hypothetical protein KSE_43280 [Kitasatospora setae KM-6054]